jgi:hypothetical protein
MFRYRLLILTAMTTLAFAADPFLGSWKTDVERSKLSPERLERHKGEVFTIESAGENTYHVRVQRPDQKAATLDNTWIVDGKEHEEQHRGRALTMKVERISEWRLRTTAKSGESTTVYNWAVTPDGKTLTSTPQSKPDETIVYSKQ